MSHLILHSRFALILLTKKKLVGADALLVCLRQDTVRHTCIVHHGYNFFTFAV